MTSAGAALTAATGEAAPSAGHVALHAGNVSKRYGRSTSALRDVSVDVPCGGITALVGPNAAGKSTLIKTWIGFERPTAGRVSVAGVISRCSAEQASAKIAYVPQRPELYRELTVSQNITYAAYLRPALDVAGAIAYVDRLSIPLDARLARLSGGQAAQVVLSIALASGAEILLLDEPLASLDPLARHEVLELLQRAVEERGLTALLSSHIVRDVEQASDHLIVLGVGRVLPQHQHRVAIQEHRVVADSSVAETAVAQLPGNRSGSYGMGQARPGRPQTWRRSCWGIWREDGLARHKRAAPHELLAPTGAQRRAP